jgi:hypothetical protein
MRPRERIVGNWSWWGRRKKGFKRREEGMGF